MTTTVETPTMTPTTTENNPSDLDKVIADTQAEISSNEVKEENKTKRTRKKKDLEPVKMQQVSASQYKEVMGGLIQFTGIYLSRATKWEGFQLSKDETDLLAMQASELAVDFMPAVQSKYVKVGAFSMTLIAVFGMRYMEFQEIHKNRVATNTNSSDTINNEIQTN